MTALPWLPGHAAVRRAARSLAGGGAVAAGLSRLEATGALRRTTAGLCDPLVEHRSLTRPLARWTERVTGTSAAAGHALTLALAGLDARAATPDPDAVAPRGRDRRTRPGPATVPAPPVVPPPPLTAADGPRDAPHGGEDADVTSVLQVMRPATGGRTVPERSGAEQAWAGPRSPGPHPRAEHPAPSAPGSGADGRRRPGAVAAAARPAPPAPAGTGGGLAELLRRHEPPPLPPGTGSPGAGSSGDTWPPSPQSPADEPERSGGAPGAGTAPLRPAADAGAARAPQDPPRAADEQVATVAADGPVPAAGPPSAARSGGDGWPVPPADAKGRGSAWAGPDRDAPSGWLGDGGAGSHDAGGLIGQDDLGTAPEGLEAALAELLRREAVRYGLEAGAP
ncbi:hypothetical protein [Jannaschia sp. R86511]|uniref:hypothetical protein n=1 Tax=Jannaschia sp. R86511 TaxID=3093853 RepID=UPI0036D21EA0